MNGRLKVLLSEYAAKAMQVGLGLEADAVEPDLRATSDPRFGDYQINGVLPLAKILRENPRKLAQKVMDALDTEGVCISAEIAGPGFINLRLDPNWVAKMVGAAAADPRLNIAPVADPKTIVIDFSSPNVAKTMHVGHLRSTVLGDALVRILRFVGHTVVGDNHIGDWGTQFGILLWAWENHRDEANLEAHPIGELERLYKLGVSAGKADPEIAEACRLELAALQAGDEARLALWNRFLEISRKEVQKIYDRMDVSFDSWLGESSYNDRLPTVVQTLLDKGIAVETQGAVGIFFPEGLGLPETPFLIRKRDGAFMYSTTDIATVEYRLERWKADQILYVVDVRQSAHFKQLFQTVKMLGYTDVDLVHVGFGMILGEDGTPFKTRDGKTVPLAALIDEAEARILPIVTEKWPDLPEVEQRDIAARVGIGAVKYADMAQNLATNYKFEWDKLLAAEGNTGPYLQYTSVRTLSVLREYETREGTPFVADGSPVTLDAPEEVELAFHLVRFGDTLERTAQQLHPHVLCEYLFQLAKRFNAFYGNCPILKHPEHRKSRMTLVQATQRAFEIGLACLNLPHVDRM